MKTFQYFELKISTCIRNQKTSSFFIISLRVRETNKLRKRAEDPRVSSRRRFFVRLLFAGCMRGNRPNAFLSLHKIYSAIGPLFSKKPVADLRVYEIGI